MTLTGGYEGKEGAGYKCYQVNANLRLLLARMPSGYSYASFGEMWYEAFAAVATDFQLYSCPQPGPKRRVQRCRKPEGDKLEEDFCGPDGLHGIQESFVLRTAEFEFHLGSIVDLSTPSRVASSQFSPGSHQSHLLE